MRNYNTVTVCRERLNDAENCTERNKQAHALNFFFVLFFSLHFTSSRVHFLFLSSGSSRNEQEKKSDENENDRKVDSRVSRGNRCPSEPGEIGTRRLRGSGTEAYFDLFLKEKDSSSLVFLFLQIQTSQKVKRKKPKKEREKPPFAAGMTVTASLCGVARQCPAAVP